MDHVKKSFFTNRIVFSGSFDTIDNIMPCNQVGYYQNNQLSCMGNGVKGEINDLILSDAIGGWSAFGAIEHNGETFPLAFFDGTSWNYVGFPYASNATASAAFTSGADTFPVNVVIEYDSLPNHSEIWQFDGATNWVKKAQVNGVILDIATGHIGKVYAGHFDSVVTYDSSGIDTTLTANNIAIDEHYSNKWLTLGNNISDTVKTIESDGFVIYFGGTCSSNSNSSNVCMTRYYNNTLQPLILKSTFNDTIPCFINDIELRHETLIFGGKFSFFPAIGTGGRNFAVYNLVTNFIKGLAYLDKPVKNMCLSGGNFYLGGDFTFNSNSNESINHLAKADLKFSEIKEPQKNKIRAYPNPFVNKLKLKGVKPGTAFRLLNSSGQLVRQGIVENALINNLDALSDGTYILKLKTKKGQVVKHIVK